MNHRDRIKLISLLSLFSFVGLLGHTNNITLADEAAVAVPSEIQAGPRALSRAFRLAARKATPSVVTILSYGQPVAGAKPNQSDDSSTDEEDTNEDNENDDTDSSSSNAQDANQLTGLGSGVIVSKTGMVITNNHVIVGAKRVVVQLSDETEIEATEVYGDAASDVATLKIAIPQEEWLAGVRMVDADIANSDLIEIGDWVLAIGSPFRLDATVSAGIISAKDRTLGRIRRGRLIQTDAAINPGNSGGPLINLDGDVVAINTAIATRNGGYQGIGFAIPINQAKWIAEELAAHGKVRRAAIGIIMAELKPRIARQFKLPAGIGILAYQVIENSAAQRAGIQPLDVITEFAGERVNKPSNLQRIVERSPIGSFQEVVVLRRGEKMKLEIEIASLEDPTLTQVKDEEEKDDTVETETNEDVSGEDSEEAESEESELE
ncbi:Periplasmic serine endoprotease DegP precursor [Rubripirellula obstinata]|uniref:Periplasmic serine endoprotease DegP n=1 Tax=Rubripirellula obstinata TaxID=406547 RepID=A0A5B1CLD1_9BACT|nr:trypsin-like peptidase domain-containing protein [Rubripirellula obstinata]KAA1261878.1 Periplasmic serine endoprotease DegP precursor [Rubripirellula obstinata]